MNDNSTPGKVYLVGAGPGCADLLTLRAVRCLSHADLVLYDQLVSTRALEHAPGAEHICVDQLPGCHPERWPHIHSTMIEAAKAGKSVVRLKGGDPSVFGRGGEEAEALREAGIEYEIVPGVTAALGAAAFADFPLTHRRHSSAVAIVTGHEDPDKPGSLIDWESVARFSGSLVFYMGIKRLDQLVAALIQHGKDPATPSALIEQATRGGQRTVTGELQQLPLLKEREQISAPALIVIGSVVSLRPAQSWFESLPLIGRRVLITRPAHQSRSVMDQLEQLGAIAYSMPTVQIGEPPDISAVDRAIEDVSQYQWIVFTSANGVRYFLNRLLHTGRDLRALGHCQLAVIGPATGDALREYHLEPDLIPPEYRSESLAAALCERATGQRVLMARADRGREILRDEVGKVASVDQVPVYSQTDADQPSGEVLDLIQRGAMDYILLTSSNIAKSLSSMLNADGQAMIQSGRVKLISISPVTTGDCIKLGWPVAGEADEYNLPGVINALVQHSRVC